MNKIIFVFLMLCSINFTVLVAEVYAFQKAPVESEEIVLEMTQEVNPAE